MRKRFPFALLLSLALVSALLSWPAAAPAQVRIPSETTLTGAVQRVLDTGAALEHQQRWADAVTHYEEAVRSHPGRSDLERRLTLARSHYDLGRRYADASFQRQLLAITNRQALDLYSEVLLKVHAHYVHEPDWRKLVERGRLQLDVALADPVFVERMIAETNRSRVDAVRRELVTSVGAQLIRNRHEARAVVDRVSQRTAQALGVSPTSLVLEFLCGATNALDTYSSFLTGDQLDDVFSQIEGNFVGLGIEVKVEEDSLLVVHVISGGPASEAGIRGGDRIIEVNGQRTDAIATEKAADMLRGPEGTHVDVVTRTPQQIVRKFRLARRRVEVPSVEKARLLDRRLGIAYAHLSSFQKTTSRDLDQTLWRLHRDGMRYLILDVRGNPGGLLPAAVDVADKFVSAGTLVSTRGRSQREDFDYRAHQVGTWRVPLMVLIDHDSASASEIFAGAIRDHRRGTVVGERSYGKGSVQGIFPLTSTKAGIRLTTAKFYSPNGQAISRRGVSPDVPVQVTQRVGSPAVAAPPRDVTLDTALQLARDQLQPVVGSR